MENKLIVGGDLSQRKKLILRSVIESHITTGEPIGSKYLMTKSDIPYSSATIRNEMAELEDMGYLEQPHTSAGRVPTSLGYRFYVDALMESYKLTATEIVSLNNIIKNKMGELDSILKSASKLIASMTNYTTVAVKAPHTDALTVSQFSYMLLEPTAFLLVMRMSDGNVETRHIRTEIPVDEEMLSKLSDVLGDNFCGVTSNAITLPMIMKAETEMGSAGTIIALAIKALYDTIGKPDEADINFEGINRLLEYPEFSDVEQMKKVEGVQVYYRGIDPTPIRDFVMTGFNTATRIGNAIVLPGDIVFGAGGGVLFIPAHLVAEVVDGASKTQVKDLFGFEMIAQNKFTTAQIDKNTWTKDMLDLLMDFIEKDERAKEYRGLDWSVEYDLAIHGDPNDTQTAL